MPSGLGVSGLCVHEKICYFQRMNPLSNFRLHLTSLARLALAAVCITTFGCAIHHAPPVLPEQHLLEAGQLEIHSDFQLPKSHRLVTELVAQRRDLANLLGVEPSEEPIHVFLFEQDKDYRQYMSNQHPDFPARRALFVKTDTQLKVYASWHPRVAEDLRHEVTHGYLHSAVSDIPLWLDEGLAEFFETGRANRGSHNPHIHLLKTRLKQGKWSPDLNRLEAIDEAEALTRLDYAESWLWVHFLLFSPAIQEQHLVQAHLIQLRKQGSAFSIAAAVDGRLDSVESALIEHLKSL